MENMKRPRTGSSGVLVKDGKLMLGLSKKWSKWVIPGGAVDYMESYKDAVVREIREETGLEVVWIKLLDIFEVLHTETDNHRILIYSEVRHIGGNIKPGDDIDEIGFFDRDEIARMYRQNSFTEIMAEVLKGLGWLHLESKVA